MLQTTRITRGIAIGFVIPNSFWSFGTTSCSYFSFKRAIVPSHLIGRESRRRPWPHGPCARPRDACSRSGWAGPRPWRAYITLADRDRGLTLDDATGDALARVGLLVALDHVDLLHDHPAGLAVNPQDLALLAPVLAGNDQHLVALLDLRALPSSPPPTEPRAPARRSS